jgi:N-methylhydantoinase A/oxoprolinase/acetone carboxylase beta subunit
MPERVASPISAAAPAAERAVRAFSFTGASWTDFTLVERNALSAGDALAGPSLIAEETSTTYLDRGFRASVHRTGSLQIVRDG